MQRSRPSLAVVVILSVLVALGVSRTQPGLLAESPLENAMMNAGTPEMALPLPLPAAGQSGVTVVGQPETAGGNEQTRTVFSCPSSSSSAPPRKMCGNGIIESGEDCDDKNTISGDGCSNRCNVEPYWSCTKSPSVCTTICGDGVVVRDHEECDDANYVSGDGCSDCLIEVPIIHLGAAAASSKKAAAPEKHAADEQNPYLARARSLVESYPPAAAIPLLILILIAFVTGTSSGKKITAVEPAASVTPLAPPAQNGPPDPQHPSGPPGG
jgi:cysteine-rich repeat protein